MQRHLGPSGHKENIPGRFVQKRAAKEILQGVQKMKIIKFNSGHITSKGKFELYLPNVFSILLRPKTKIKSLRVQTRFAMNLFDFNTVLSHKEHDLRSQRFKKS